MNVLEILLLSGEGRCAVLAELLHCPGRAVLPKSPDVRLMLSFMAAHLT